MRSLAKRFCPSCDRVERRLDRPPLDRIGRQGVGLRAGPLVDVGEDVEAQRALV
jgi:hypothetical protein